MPSYYTHASLVDCPNGLSNLRDTKALLHPRLSRLAPDYAWRFPQGHWQLFVLMRSQNVRDRSLREG